MTHLSTEELLQATQRLIQSQRQLNVLLVEHLEEIQRRKVYAKLGYASLWEFATQYLGLSEGAASRRIQAMRLIRQTPQALESLRSGSLSLSNAATVQSFLQAEAKQGRYHGPEDVIQKVLHLSQRDCEAKLLEISPEALPREQTRIVSGQKHRELRLVVSPETFEKMERLRGLLAHTVPGAGLAEIVAYATDIALAHLEKQKGAAPKTPNLSTDNAGDQEVQSSLPTGITAAAEVATELPSGKRVYLPRRLTRIVWARGQGCCEFSTPERRCNSRYGLEIDHIVPLASGGANSPDNLRLLCREHNLFLSSRGGADPP